MSLLLAFQGAAGISGTLAVTEGADAASFTASEIFTGALAATDGADTAGFSGAEIFLGALAVTEGADLAAFGGTVAAAGFHHAPGPWRHGLSGPAGETAQTR